MQIQDGFVKTTTNDPDDAMQPLRKKRKICVTEDTDTNDTPTKKDEVNRHLRKMATITPYDSSKWPEEIQALLLSDNVRDREQFIAREKPKFRQHLDKLHDIWRSMNFILPNEPNSRFLTLDYNQDDQQPGNQSCDDPDSKSESASDKNANTNTNETIKTKKKTKKSQIAYDTPSPDYFDVSSHSDPNDSDFNPKSHCQNKGNRTVKKSKTKTKTKSSKRTTQTSKKKNQKDARRQSTLARRKIVEDRLQVCSI